MAKKLYIAIAVLVILCLAGIFRWEEGRVEKIAINGGYNTTQYLYDRWLQREWVKITSWSSGNYSYSQETFPLDKGNINLKELVTDPNHYGEYLAYKAWSKKINSYTNTATQIWRGLISINIIIILGMLYIMVFKLSIKPGQTHL
ncbi:MAG: hypothetical protein JL56_04580 [Desulfotomaculum sp. BICA1-6]|nr:MAG: hypothetical protein JL56_04580 [Desulfotomaculum sp. BICA1-6]